MVTEMLSKALREVLTSAGITAEVVSVVRTQVSSHGDFASNVAMVYAKNIGRNPVEFATTLVQELEKKQLSFIKKIEVAPPGFINFFLEDTYFIKKIDEILKHEKEYGSNALKKDKKILIEYTDPNPFKPFHIGHLMTNAIGESLARILSFSGATVIRANYQGDIGPHVAKALYGLLHTPPDKTLSVEAQAQFIGECYAYGSQSYENDVKAKLEIEAINKSLYEKSNQELQELYLWGREVTLEAFETIYNILGTAFDVYYFESEMAPKGSAIVRANIGTVFTESEGALVFHAEEINPKLHTRVFINSHGLPTYEAKELGLTKTKFDTINPDISITVTANEQMEYMRVVTEALRVLYPDIASRMVHISHGMMRFASGKMSSRKGNVVTGVALLEQMREYVREKIKDSSELISQASLVDAVAVSAIKYSIIRQALGHDIIFDFETSVSFEGDSGPYIQYTYARTASILAKAGEVGIEPSVENKIITTGDLERQLDRFPDVVRLASIEHAPHHIATYLIELSRAFNAYYAETRIVEKDNDESSYRIALTKACNTVLAQGLYLLGIKAPEKM